MKEKFHIKHEYGKKKEIILHAALWTFLNNGNSQT